MRPDENDLPVSFTSVPCTDSTTRLEVRWATATAFLPSGVNTTSVGRAPLANCTCPALAICSPLMVKMDIVLSSVLATRASLPSGLMEIPLAPGPACAVWTTCGLFGAERSTTETTSLGIRFVPSSCWQDVTRANLLFLATATEAGGPIMAAGAATDPNSLTWPSEILSTEILSGSGLVTVSPGRICLPSLAETAISALAATDMASHTAKAALPVFHSCLCNGFSIVVVFDQAREARPQNVWICER